ncbi:MAG: PAS domain S-box protein [Ignavibacteriales bacterium]|nr:PAS domain S-box protein [Ignavibacteriales bacterium]
MNRQDYKGEWWSRFTWYLVAAIGAWTISFTILFVAYLQSGRDDVLETSRRHAQLLFDRDAPFAVLPSPDDVPNAAVEMRSTRPPSTVRETVRLTPVHRMQSRTFSFLSIDSLSAGNGRPVWQQRALDHLREGSPSEETIATLDGEECYFLFKPLRADSTCAACHDRATFRPGELTGAVQMCIPTTMAYEATKKSVDRIGIGILGLWMLGVLSITVAGNGMRRQLRAHLRAETLFKTVWDGSFDGMRVMDERGVVLRVNDAYCRMMNAQRKNVEGRPYPVVYEQQQQDSMLKTYVGQMQGDGVAAQAVYHLRLWDGSFHWLELSNSVLDLPDPGVQLLSIVRDVTEQKEKEIALRHSEENYRLLFEGSPIGIFRIGMDGQLFAANPALTEMLGYLCEEELLRAINKNEAQLFAHQGLRDEMLNQLRGGIPLVHVEQDLRRKDGSSCIGKVAMKLVVGMEDAERHAIGTVEDISDRKAAERALERKMESEALLADISEKLFRTTTERFSGTVKESLRLLTQFMGASRGYVNLFSGVYFGEEDVAEWSEEGERPLLGVLEGRPLSSFAWMLAAASENQYAAIENIDSFPAFAAAERALWQECHLSKALVVPVLREQTTIGILMFTMVGDMTDWHYQDVRLLRMAGEILVTAIERKRTDVNLRQSEKRLSDLAENMLDVVCQIDENGMFRFASPSFLNLFGRAYGDVVGNSFAEYLHPEEKKQFSFTPDPGILLSAKSRTECRYRHADGHYLWLEIFSTRMVDEAGGVIGTVMGMRDITERKIADEKINVSLREKEILLKEIHHRVKNNLQVISSLLNLQASYLSDPRTRELFAESQNRVRSMALIHEKLYQSEDFVAIDFAEYINGLAGFLYRSYAINPEKIVLTIDVKDVALGMVSAVPCGLIINELLSNALKYAFPSGRNGSIMIQLMQSGGNEHLLRVVDDGIGLPAGLDLGNVQSLGLQLVDTLTRQLQGRWQVRRTPGTQFSIYFKGQQE